MLAMPELGTLELGKLELGTLELGTVAIGRLESGLGRGTGAIAGGRAAAGL